MEESYGRAEPQGVSEPSRDVYKLGFSYTGPGMYLRGWPRRGFEQAGPEFRWEVPDLQVMVLGDRAVTWGLNRVARRADGKPAAMWSRGTRVLRPMDGRWRMIHQHVFFPIDLGTEQARTDIVP